LGPAPQAIYTTSTLTEQSTPVTFTVEDKFAPATWQVEKWGIFGNFFNYKWIEKWGYYGFLSINYDINIYI
jgi:hypothetical protein